MDEGELRRRFSHPLPTSERVVAAHEKAHRELVALALMLNELLPECREKAKAMSRIEEAAIYVDAAISRTQLRGAPGSD